MNFKPTGVVAAATAVIAMIAVLGFVVPYFESEQSTPPNSPEITTEDSPDIVSKNTNVKSETSGVDNTSITGNNIIVEGDLIIEGKNSSNVIDDTDVKNPTEPKDTEVCPDGTEPKDGECIDKEIFIPPYYGSISYDSFDKSPFAELQENHEMYWILEDFKDGTMNARGVIISPDYTVVTGYSVDKDDGIRDQVGNEGGSMVFEYEYLIQIKFDKRQLEEFPTHAGFVVTSHSTHNNNFPAIFKFEAFDSDGELIISVPNLTSGRDGKSTTDDKFFGVYGKDGIQSLQLTAQGPANIFIDHLQYGR